MKSIRKRLKIILIITITFSGVLLYVISITSINEIFSAHNITPLVKTIAAITRKDPKSIEDYKFAEKWNIQAALKGDPDAANFMGFISKEGLSTNSPLVAEGWFSLAARGGHAAAMYELGKNQEIALNYKMAIKWYMQSAYLGNPEASLALADMYLNEKGLKNNQDKVLFYMREAAINNSAVAQYNLANFMNDGIYITKNKREAGLWYKRAALNGIKAAQIKIDEAIGLCVEKIETFTLLNAEACILVQTEKNPKISEQISELYFNDFLLKKDDSKSLEWLLVSVKNGGVSSSFTLAKRFFKGVGTLKNDSDSYTYWTVYTKRFNKYNKQELPNEAIIFSREIKSKIGLMDRLRGKINSIKYL